MDMTRKLFEHTRVFGLFFVLALCFLCSYLFLDDRLLYRNRVELGFWRQSQNLTKPLRLSEFGVGKGAPGGGGVCDLFDGMWVWDDGYPLYDSRGCGFLDGGFRCSENGRPDSFYAKWRWQPRHCDLPRFNAKAMLKRLRNRRVVFVGDSIGRNQWESLLCMLSTAVPDKSSIYEVNGNPINKHDGFFVFKFKQFNCNIEYYRSPFLVPRTRAPAGAQKEVKSTLRLDVMDWTSSRWRDADVLIFNTGHWWNHGKTIKGGCYFQEGNEVKMDMSVESAYQRSFETLFRWIHTEVNMSKTQVIFRTYAPIHYGGGDWKTAGNCHLETRPKLDALQLPSRPWSLILDSVFDVLSGYSSMGVAPELNVLNVTLMTDQRKDGHPSVYYMGPNHLAPLHRQDCSHWCLPGVPDAWNELLYALFLRREVIRHKSNSTSKIQRG